MRNYKVYKHTFPNDKVYIGISSYKNIESQRWKNGNGYNKQTYMRNAIRKYGWENIKHEILFDNLKKDDAENKEIELISRYRSNEKKFGYNIQLGGNLRGSLSPNGRKVLSNKMKINNPMKNIETIKKVVSKNKGKHLSEHHKYLLSENSGVKRKIICINDGEIFDSIEKASKKYNIDRSSISNVCLHKRNTAGGYSFAYIEDLDRKIRKNKCQIKIKCIETSEIFESVSEASYKLTNKKTSNISNALNGRCKTAYGYHWIYI